MNFFFTYPRIARISFLISLATIFIMTSSMDVSAQSQIPVDVGVGDTMYTDLNSSGYWFTAPECIIITGLFVPTTATSLPQSIEVVRFEDPPPDFPSITDEFDTLRYIQGADDTNIINTNFLVNAGDIIGILGNRSTGESNNIYHRGDYLTSILGSALTLKRIVMNDNIYNDMAIELSGDSLDTAHYPIIEFFFDTAITASFTSAVFGDTVEFLSTSEVSTNFLWDFGDGTTSTEEEIDHIYEDNGDYTVTLTVSNSCFSATTTETIVINGIAEFQQSQIHVDVFPNVTQNVFSIEVATEYRGKLEIKLTDLNGQVIYSEMTESLIGKLKREIDMSDQASGIYLLKVANENGVIVKKLTLL